MKWKNLESKTHPAPLYPAIFNKFKVWINVKKGHVAILNGPPSKKGHARFIMVPFKSGSIM